MHSTKLYDVLVVGGGINGCGIARDAAGRGLSVLLCEQDDLAGHTSSASTKLIHGGLRYLEHYEFKLVREALVERERLLRAAPHIIRPLQFVMPHSPGLRPAWLIRSGLFLYDHLAKRERLPGSRRITLRANPLGHPLQAHLCTEGFVYSDARVDDARLVVLNAMDAAERGAAILARTRCVSLRRRDDRWVADLRSAAQGGRQTIQARVLVNAAGPWASSLLRAAGVTRQHRLRLAKGSHIVVRKLFDHDHAYLLQNPDGRVGFAIPYEGDFTLVGTTDVEFEGDPAEVSIAEHEIAYLCRMVNRCFKRQISPVDVAWSYSGVRPLLDDASSNLSAVTRDYRLDYDAGDGRAPLLSVLGGKITTYRRLAEKAVNIIAPGVSGAWTARAPLPGGDIVDADFDGFFIDLSRRYPWLPRALLRRYAHAYGTRLHRLLDGATALADLGEPFGDGLYEAEVDYLVKYEWAQTTGDILWRRSKLGLQLAPDAVQRLRERLASFRVDHGANSNPRSANA